MTDAKHTPGPWAFEAGENADIFSCVYRLVDGDYQGIVYLTLPNHAANAHLIAAAPDLLEALKAAQAIINPLSGFVKRGDAKAREHLESRREMIRAALRKAKGEQS